MEPVIRAFASTADAEAFRTLNREWIAHYFVIEEEDERQLSDPVRAYLDPGGEIFFAELDGRVIGCVAIVPEGSGAWELSKMAVTPAVRGGGIGRRLLTAAIDGARERGARAVFLGTSTQLPNAVHLYEALGFQHVAPDTMHMPYDRADVFMRLELATEAPGPL